MLKYASASIALLALSNPALAASGCANPTEAAALKTAVLQQELMVAALQCREAGAYNRFVNTFRPELQSSDASLKAFFVRRGGEHGEAGYDAFKTKAANLSALENARDAKAFCADARALFQAAMAHHGSLMSFVNSRAGADIGNVCIDSRPGPVLAQVDSRGAEIKAPPGMTTVINPAAAALTAAPAKPIPITPPVAAAIKAAAAPVQVAVGGVPTYNVPSIPYRSEGAPPAPAPQPEPAPAILARTEPAPAPVERAEPRQDYAEQDAILRDRQAARQEQLEDDAAAPYEAEEAAPPPRPRYYRARAPRYVDPYSYAYAPRAYPPAWQYQYRYPQPPSRYWYRRDDW